jgi:hypothetical protein
MNGNGASCMEKGFISMNTAFNTLHLSVTVIAIIAIIFREVFSIMKKIEILFEGKQIFCLLDFQKKNANNRKMK